MKTSNKFHDSPVMRELERLDIAKNGVEPVLTKKASTPDLLSELVQFSKNLRKAGKVNEANRLDEKIVRYATAVDDGDKLIEQAHPEGDVEIEPAQNDYGKIETQVSQHKKIVDMVQGKKSAADILNEVAGKLKKKAAANQTIAAGAAKLREIDTQWNNYWKNISFGISGWKISSAAFGDVLTQTGGWGPLPSIGVGSPKKVEEGPAYGLFVQNAGKDAVQEALDKFNTSSAGGLTPVFGTIFAPLVDKANKSLQNQINTIKSKIRTLEVSDNAFELNQAYEYIKAYTWMIDHLVEGEADWQNSFNEALDLVKKGIDEIKSKYDGINQQLRILYQLQVNRGQKSQLRQVSSDVELNKLAVDLKVSPDIQTISAKLNEYIQNWGKQAKKNKDSLEKKAQTFDAPPPAPKPVEKPVPTAAKPIPKAGPARKSTEQLRQELIKWQQTVDPEYWKSVAAMQSWLHQLSTISGLPVSESEAATLRSTAIPGLALSGADFDGKWGSGTVKALETAKAVLSKLNKDKAEQIDSGAKMAKGSYSGYLYYATDGEKQKQVAKIAQKNIALIREILGEKGLSTGKEESAAAVRYDLVPTGIDWGSEQFVNTPAMSGGQTKDKAGKITPYSSAPITNHDLLDMSSFSKWMALNNKDPRWMAQNEQPYGIWRQALLALFNRAKKLLEVERTSTDKSGSKTASIKKAQVSNTGKLTNYINDLYNLIKRLDSSFKIWSQQTGKTKDTPVSGDELEQALSKTESASNKTGPGRSGVGSEGYDVEGAGKETQDLLRVPFQTILDIPFLSRYSSKFNEPISTLSVSLQNILMPRVNIADLTRNLSNPENTPIFRSTPVDWNKKITFIGLNPASIIQTPRGAFPLSQLEDTTVAPVVESKFRLALIVVAMNKLETALTDVIEKWEEQLSTTDDFEGKDFMRQSAYAHLSRWKETIGYLRNYAMQKIRQG